MSAARQHNLLAVDIERLGNQRHVCRNKSRSHITHHIHGWMDVSMLLLDGTLSMRAIRSTTASLQADVFISQNKQKERRTEEGPHEQEARGCRMRASMHVCENQVSLGSLGRGRLSGSRGRLCSKVDSKKLGN